MEGRFLLVFAYCALAVAHDQSGSIPDSIAACEGGYSCAGDENLRERIPDGQQRRELPLERRF